MAALTLFRAVFYPGAIVAAFLLAHARFGHHDPPPPPPARPPLAGRTAQGERVRIHRDAHGRPAMVSTRLTATCPNGHTWYENWSVTPPALRNDDGLLNGYERRSDGASLWINARAAGDKVSGTLWLTIVFPSSSKVCRSGPVDFTAER